MLQTSLGILGCSRHRSRPTTEPGPELRIVVFTPAPAPRSELRAVHSSRNCLADWQGRGEVSEKVGMILTDVKVEKFVNQNVLTFYNSHIHSKAAIYLNCVIFQMFL